MSEPKRISRKGTMAMVVEEAQEILDNPHLWALPKEPGETKDSSSSASSPSPSSEPDVKKSTDTPKKKRAAPKAPKKKESDASPRPTKKRASSGDGEARPAKRQNTSKLRASMPTANGDEASVRTYEIAGLLVRDRLLPAERELLGSLTAEDLIIIEGSADHTERVAESVGIPFTRISGSVLSTKELSPRCTVYINCMAQIDSNGDAQLAEFVSAGGLLVTTDHAIDTCAQAFPGYIARGSTLSTMNTISVQVANFNHPVLQGFFDEDIAPQWKVAGGSYAISVVNEAKVEVLLRSDMLPKAQQAVVVTFAHGAGRVYHMVSHFHLQAQAQHSDIAASEYARRKCASEELVKRIEQEEAKTGSSVLRAGSVQAAATSVEFLVRSLLQHHKPGSTADAAASATTNVAQKEKEAETLEAPAP